jgi:hypothetical protein
MRIEIIPTQAAASTGPSARPHVGQEIAPHRASRSRTPVALSSLRADPVRQSPFSAAAVTPVPVRWDVVRG